MIQLNNTETEEHHEEHHEEHGHEHHEHGGQHLESGGHSHGDGTFWGEFTALITDPAHWLFELVATLTIDLLVIALGYHIIVRKIIIPRLRKQIHSEIDAEHHIEHTDDGGHIHKEHKN